MKKVYYELGYLKVYYNLKYKEKMILMCGVFKFIMSELLMVYGKEKN